MTRRISAGSAGGAGVAGLQAFTTTITSADNLDITVDPAGTGRFLVDGPTQLQSQNQLRFADNNNSNYVGFQSPATISTNRIWTLPAADGSNRQTLTTNGSGVLTWQTPTISVEDEITSTVAHFVTLTTATTNTTINTVRRSSTKLTFQPSTGTLSTTIVSATTFNGALATNLSQRVNSLGVNTNAGGQGEIRATGDITAHFSDERLKTFKGKIENALDKIEQLNGYYFIENEKAKELGYNNDNLQVGVSAQEVERVLPEVVADAPINANFEDTDYKTVRYEKLVPLLIEAIKELKTIVDKKLEK
jgi:hypothetical protein